MSTLQNLSLIEKSDVELKLDVKLDIRHARWLRGAIGTRETRNEFHQHDNSQLLYRHPLIRYDTSDGCAAIRGLNEGSLLLRAFSPPSQLRLGNDSYTVAKHETKSARVEVGSTSEFVSYRFTSPWLPLNQENRKRWMKSCSEEQHILLIRILCGNVLSFCKSVGHHVNQRIEVVCIDVKPTQAYDLKPGVKLLGFSGSFAVNFSLPNKWGIGKSSARGFGTIVREDA